MKLFSFDIFHYVGKKDIQHLEMLGLSPSSGAKDWLCLTPHTRVFSK